MLRFLAGVFMHLLDFSPIFLVAFLVFSSWAILYLVCWLQLIVPGGSIGLDLGMDMATIGNRSLVSDQLPSFLPYEIVERYLNGSLGILMQGIALLVMFAIIRITWVGAWVQILVITWCKCLPTSESNLTFIINPIRNAVCDRKWKPSRTCKNIMQVDSMAWQDAEWSPFKGSWIPYEEGKFD